MLKIHSVYVVSTWSCALLLASPDVLFYCPQPFCLCTVVLLLFTSLEFLLLRPYGCKHSCCCWHPQVFQLSLVLLSGLLLMCSYRCCFIPGPLSSVDRVSAAFRTAVEASSVTGVSNILAVPVAVVSLLLLASLLLLPPCCC